MNTTIFIAHSFEELTYKLSHWVNFHQEGEGVYDAIGMLLLLKSCLTNLSQQLIPADFEVLQDFFSAEELKLLKLIMEASSIDGEIK